MAMIPARPYSHFHIEKKRFLLYIYKVPLKIRLKTIKFTCLCVFTMVLSVCVQPVDVGSFMNNDRVVDQVEKGAGRVIIGSGSDTGLSAGNGRISGLNPSKYYRVEELDEKGDIISTDFVTKTGTIGDLGKIGKSSQITGLTNNVTYKVTSAESFQNNTLYYFKITEPISTQTASVTNGKVIFYQDGSSTDYFYFTLNNTIDQTKNYEVMKISINDNEVWQSNRTSAIRMGSNPNITSSIPLPLYNNSDYQRFNESLNIGIYEYDPTAPTYGYTGTITPSFLANKSITALPALNTENDYVFVEYTNTEITGKFYVLNVSRKPNLGGATVNITGPGVPADATCSLVAGGTDSAKIDVTNNGKDFVVTLTKPITAGTLTLTVNSTPSVNISAVKNGEGNTITSTTGLTFATPNSGSNTITFTINTDNAPFDTLTALSGSYNIVVECVGNFSLPTIFIKVK